MKKFLVMGFISFGLMAGGALYGQQDQQTVVKDETAKVKQVLQNNDAQQDKKEVKADEKIRKDAKEADEQKIKKEGNDADEQKMNKEEKEKVKQKDQDGHKEMKKDGVPQKEGAKAKSGSKGNSGKGNAYGKSKGTATGKEFGKERSEASAGSKTTKK